MGGDWMDKVVLRDRTGFCQPLVDYCCIKSDHSFRWTSRKTFPSLWREKRREAKAGRPNIWEYLDWKLQTEAHDLKPLIHLAAHRFDMFCAFSWPAETIFLIVSYKWRLLLTSVNNYNKKSPWKPCEIKITTSFFLSKVWLFSSRTKYSVFCIYITQFYLSFTRSSPFFFFVSRLLKNILLRRDLCLAISCAG